jgi:hypothetical protein
MAFPDKWRPSEWASKKDMGERLKVANGDVMARVIMVGSLLGKR